jgi:hypothetical protein
MVEVLEYLHKYKIYNVNLNIFNVIICREKLNTGNLFDYSVKLSDIEIPHIIKNNFKVI